MAVLKAEAQEVNVNPLPARFLAACLCEVYPGGL